MGFTPCKAEQPLQDMELDKFTPLQIDSNQDEQQGMTHQQNSKTVPSQKNQTLRKNLNIHFQTIVNDTWKQVKLHSRAGNIRKNKSIKYKSNYNIEH